MSLNNMTSSKIFMPNQRLMLKIILIALCMLAVAILLIMLYVFQAPQNLQKQVIPDVTETEKPVAIESATVPERMIDRMRKMVKPAPERPKPKTPPAPKTEAPPPAQPKHTFRKGQTGPVADRSEGPSVKGGGGTMDIKGTIPELSLDLAGHTPEQVAAYFGFALAAQSFSDNALLGVVEKDALVPLPQSDLRRFSTRGRSADGIKDEFTLKRRIAEALGRPFDDIGLIYLVPRSVDKQWISWQKSVVRQSGYTLNNVTRIDALYGQNFTLHASALVLKNGQTVPVEGDRP